MSGILALRNLLRNRRKSFFTFLAMACGCAAVVLFGGFMDYSLWGLRESTIRSRLGHLQIAFQETFSAGASASTAVGMDERLLSRIRELLQHDSRILLWAPRLGFSGLVSNGEQSRIFSGQGIAPLPEQELGGAFLDLLQGSFLEPGDKETMLLGAGLAAAFGARSAESYTLLSSTADGSFNALDVTVKGIFSSGFKEMDDRTLMVPLETARRLLQSEHTERLLVLLRRTEDTRSVRRALEARLKNIHPRLEIKTWQELAGFYHKVARMYEGTFGFIRIIVYLVVLFSIANTFGFAVLERTREIGTMMALGAGPGRVVGVFMLEGFLLGALGGLAGLLLATLAAAVINHAGGISIPPPPGSNRGYVIFINLVPAVMLQAFCGTLLAACAATLLPSLKAARLRVADALRAL